MSFMKVLLINPWITDFAAYDFWLKPLGILYIGGVLKYYGYDVSLIDCLDRYDFELLQRQKRTCPKNRYFSTGKFHREIIPKPELYRNIPRNYARYGLPIELFRAKLKRLNQPAVVLMTSGMTYWYPGVFCAISEVRKQWPDVPIVLGGIYATLCRDHAVETSGADFVISGEAEFAALKLVDTLTGIKRDYSDFPDHIDGLPHPAFELYNNLSFACIMTSRGCPLKCTFCASSIVSGTYRWRSPETVIQELQYYYDQLRVREFAFYDDALLTNHKNHLSRILTEIIRRGWRGTFHTPNGLQSKLLDKEIAELMFQAGCKSLRLSYESGNSQRQKDMSKKVNNEVFVRAVRNLYQAGYQIGDLDAYVMMGLPGQPIEEVLWSMAFVHAQGVKIRLAAFSPIPGTLEWDRAVKECGFPENADPLLSNNSILPVKPKGTTFKTFEKVSLLAKHLNMEIANKTIDRHTNSLVKHLKSHFSQEEFSHSVSVAFQSFA
jgi:hypothetical protein